MLIVWPDGTGKSTLAQGLVDGTKREFPNVLLHARASQTDYPPRLLRDRPAGAAIRDANAC